MLLEVACGVEVGFLSPYFSAREGTSLVQCQERDFLSSVPRKGECPTPRPPQKKKQNKTKRREGQREAAFECL